jgi:anti-sigma regulatory factor (Ser/Thr protein kinase)
VVLECTPTPASAGAARRFVRAATEAFGCPDDVVERTVLIVSELATNAVFHARSPFVVSVEPLTEDTERESHIGGVRVGVADSSPVPPVRRDYGDHASTGRGLHVLDSCANAWGVDMGGPTDVSVSDGGKVVWAEVRPSHEEPAVENGELTNVTADLAVDGSQRVQFLQVPVTVYLELQEHNDAILRELELLALLVDVGSPDAEVAPALEALIERARAFFSVQREGFRQEVAAAAAEGAETIDLGGSYRIVSLPAVKEFLALFDDAEELCARQELLTPPPPHDVIALRRFFADEMERQLEHGEPPAPFTSAG